MDVCGIGFMRDSGGRGWFCWCGMLGRGEALRPETKDDRKLEQLK